MVFQLEHERLPKLDNNGGVLYSLSFYRRHRKHPMSSQQNNPDKLIPLIQKISTGDESAMTKLYDLTVHRIYGMALKIMLRPELAEEVVGDVYLQAWKQADHFNSERSTPIGWLLMMCRSRSLDKLRREKSATRNQYQENEQHTSDNSKDETIEMPLDEMMQDEITEELSSAMKLLNLSQRQTIALAFYRGMSHQQISDYTGEPLGTVKSNIRRAQQVLRNALEKNKVNSELRAGGLYG